VENFSFYNPVRIEFGKGKISTLSTLVNKSQKIMLLCGGGSIKKNGVYDQVIKALSGYDIIEFWGIEPNPLYETCMNAVQIIREKKIDFLLSVGGGSVLDATKFMAAAAVWDSGDPWNIFTKQAPIKKAMALGSVLTLPATGSEMNANSVITRKSTNEKFAFSNPQVFPQFSILDPETTFTLPKRQVINGVVDAFVHTTEQYLTYPVNAELQDRQAEAVLKTLVDMGPQVLNDPGNYNVRANIMWCATQALNGTIACGVPQDWATHMIGHEITALYGLDHAQTLAIVLPGVLKNQIEEKKEKLIQYGERVWKVNQGTNDQKATAAIEKTEQFFNSIGMKTKLNDYGIDGPECQEKVSKRLELRGTVLGENSNITFENVREILADRY
jgi:NADP-dependent alcohol dehydrogenase